MVWTPLPKLKVLRLSHSKKAAYFKSLNESGKVTFFKLSQSAKAYGSIDVVEDGVAKFNVSMLPPV
ncbi:hypothetical protein FACS1894166_08260 [Bacilli bacterium]|nr:hypothetical protein FACS1894166_08260 [Bacilli bacterium]